MHSIRLRSPCDFAGWRDGARTLLHSHVSPDDVTWSVDGESASLFDVAADTINVADPRIPAASEGFRVLRAFIRLAMRVALHRDPMRFGRLYRLLWRLRRERGLLAFVMDEDVAHAMRMAQAVRRDVHKMKAFLRFRETPIRQQRWLIAWFEPEHHILEAVAPFFVRRFANERWSILTPERSAHWDRQTLRFGPKANRNELPRCDAAEALWLSYYASIFNPARLKFDTMRGHMPQRYWRNLPEAALIPELVAEASGRTEQMLNKTPTESRRAKRAPAATRVRPAPPDTTLDALRSAVDRCRDCPLYRNATQAVFGAGPEKARIVLVGEQPGDQEDLSGEPFVGPAGKMLDRALIEAGVERKLTYVTNAVKHFKFEPRGKRRIHKKPNEMEIAACNQWLQRELRVIAPKLVIALGATGARAVFGKATAIEKNRGHIIESVNAAGVHTADVLVTVHPSFLLRVPHEDKPAAYGRFVEDLKLARRYAARH
jgi:DNA polymerase